LPVVEFSEKLERENEIAYKASIAIYSGERIVSRGIAICSNKEANFIKKEAKSGSKTDEYVINSMAQTRAQGKAFRLLLGWLMKVAGYESTPAEEVQTQTATKEAEAVDVSKTLAELEKCLTMKSFQKTFNGLSKELKVNREVLKTAKKIKGLIEENEN
jgi:intergrase/recombinase